MRLYLNLCLAFLLFPALSFAFAVQLFLEPPLESACHTRQELKIYALDEEGKIALDYSGVKKIKLTVQEEAGRIKDSFRIFSPESLEFKEGVAVLTLQDDEPEDLELTLEAEGIKLPASLKLSFRDKKENNPPAIREIKLEKHNLIVLNFDRQMEEESALKKENYKAVTNRREVYPETVEYHKDYVVLKFASGFDEGEEGYIEIAQIQDLEGNFVSSGTRSPKFEGCDCH